VDYTTSDDDVCPDESSDTAGTEHVGSGTVGRICQCLASGRCKVGSWLQRRRVDGCPVDHLWISYGQNESSV
jgi:hypothetical protein